MANDKDTANVLKHFSEIPWHVTLSNGSSNGREGTFLIAFPQNGDDPEETIVLKGVELRGKEVVGTTKGVYSPDEVAEFCRSLLSILEERDLIDDDGD